MEKEEYAIVLDYLPNGYPLEGKMMPIAQAVGEVSLVLLELVPRKGMPLEVGEKVYIGEGKRDKVYYILGRMKKDKVTETSKENLKKFIEKIVKENEERFVNFFNKAESINKRIHQIELLPGIGKKYVKEIINQRNIKPFGSFEDMKKRITHLPFPERSIERRIIQELTEDERYRLFTN